MSSRQTTKSRLSDRVGIQVDHIVPSEKGRDDSESGGRYCEMWLGNLKLCAGKLDLMMINSSEYGIVGLLKRIRATYY